MKQLNHPPQHVDLTGLNLSIELLEAFLKDYTKKNKFAISTEDQCNLITINDQLQNLLLKLRVQNTFQLSLRSKVCNGRI